MTTVQQTQVILPGQTVVLPANIRIDSFITSGDIEVTSTCNNLPDPEPYVCYELKWSLQHTEGGTNTFENDEASFGSLWIGETEYPIGGALASGSPTDVFNVIQDAVPEAIFDIISVRKTDLTDVDAYTLKFRTSATVFNSGIEMSLEDEGGPWPIAYIKPELSADCDCSIDEGLSSDVHCDPVPVEA